ncbi:uncharacterized protein LOC106054447 [Biomphalaria glabrata]|uniref:Uncharacterized protein LOC106054447 n=1 Tax=Biomphalaria glabrata TaxID=6526 RepID=A0A9U8DXX7_BIOGL|nr:uncharacterized protein LOC106054447 [Biomphalaria glabrata]
MASLGFGKTGVEVRETVRSMIRARKNNGKTDSEDHVPLPHRQWLYGFLARHPELSIRSTMPLGKDRALVSPGAVELWFNKFQQTIEATDPTIFTSPGRIFNADETGFAFNTKTRQIVASKGTKNVYSITSNTKSQVSVLACCSAAGQYIPSMLIYPYKRIPQKNLLEKFPDALLQVSDNGWVTSAIFYSWLRDIFIPSTNNLPKPIILLVDGHPSHTSLLETSVICSENKIILYCLLPHASHICQPLDQAFFGAIKSAWKIAVKKHVSNVGEGVNLETFAGVFKPLWDSVTTPVLASNSFRAAGICPFNPGKVISSTKLLPSKVYLHEENAIQTTAYEPSSPVEAEMSVPVPSIDVEAFSFQESASPDSLDCSPSSQKEFHLSPSHTDANTSLLPLDISLALTPLIFPDPKGTPIDSTCIVQTGVSNTSATYSLPS